MAAARAAPISFWEGKTHRVFLLLSSVGFVALALTAFYADREDVLWPELCRVCGCKCSPQCMSFDWTALGWTWLGCGGTTGVFLALGLSPPKWMVRLRRPRFWSLVASVALLAFLVAGLAGVNPLPSWDIVGTGGSSSGNYTSVGAWESWPLLGMNAPAQLVYVIASLLLFAAVLASYGPGASLLERWGLILTSSQALLGLGFGLHFITVLISLFTEPWPAHPKC